MTKGGVLIRVKVVVSQLVMSHLADCMDEIPTVQVFEPIFVRIVRIGSTIELMGRRVLNPLLIMSILGKALGHV